MSRTTFSGPVRSGPIFDTSGNTLGSDVANVGNVVLGQSFPITQNGLTTATDIVLPAGSTIVSVAVTTRVAYTSSLDFIVTNPSGGFASLVGAQTPAVGVTQFVPGTLSEATLWTATSDDFRVSAVSASAGAGAAIVTVTYIQN